MRAFCALESPSQEAVLPGENPVGGMTHGRQGGRGGVCPLASDQIHLVTVFGLCVSERVDRGVGRHPQPSRLKISNYFCLGTYHCIANRAASVRSSRAEMAPGSAPQARAQSSASAKSPPPSSSPYKRTDGAMIAR